MGKSQGGQPTKGSAARRSGTAARPRAATPTPRTSEAHDVLGQPAHAAARAIARQRLERALEKAVPLLIARDADAAATITNEEVHDFRVALRRLRSWLRATDDLLGKDIPRRDRAALRRLARRAGAARDAQVEWQWLTAPAEPLSAPAARAARWLARDRLTSYTREREELQRRTAAKWTPLGAALAQALAPSADSIPLAPGESLASHLFPVLESHVSAARRALDAIDHHTQVTAIHRARIRVKRLRYLIEAVDTTSRTATRAVRHLRLLQDALGELHDAHVMSARLAPHVAGPRTRRAADAPRPQLRDLRALRAALRRRELAAFRRSMDLAGSTSVATMWRDPAAFARTILPPVSPAAPATA